MEKYNFKAQIVSMIMDGQTEEALDLLSKEYHVTVPLLKVGLPKKHKTTAYGCYTAKNQTISLLNRDAFVNPFVILHEFYHHIRSKAVDRIHRGTESNADKFALDFIMQYQIQVLKNKLNSQ